MSPLTSTVLAGAAAGLGMVVLVRELRPPRVSLASRLAFLDSPREPSRSDMVPPARSAPLGAVAGGWLLAHGPAVRAKPSDLAVRGRRPQQFAIRQALVALAGLLAIPAFTALLAAGGVPVPWTVPTGLAVLAASAGWCLPAFTIRTEAAEARRDARDALSAYLDIVALGMSAGHGVSEALTGAADMSDSPLVRQITDALADARLAGQPAWTALDSVGGTWDLPELRELARTLSLVYDEGAKARQTLIARADGLRGRQLTDAVGRAGARSEVMLVATFLPYAGYALLIGYPAVIRIFTL